MPMTPALALLLLANRAQAADATEVAPWLKGDVDLRYDLAAERVHLNEDNTAVGSRVTADNTVTIAGDFTVAPGLALYFALPIESTKITYADTYEMLIDPNSDSGTMVGASAQDPAPEVTGGGLSGVWIGLMGTPFSETLFANRGDKATWLADIGVRLPDGSNFWTYNQNGVRGSGPGAFAFRFRTAFSTRIRFSEPYVSASLTRSGRLNMELRDETGAVISDGTVVVRPSNEAALRAGIEVIPIEKGEVGSRFTLDFHTDFAYHSWQEIPSGTYLPSVLDASRASVATQGDTSSVKGGLTFKYRVFEYVQLDLGGDVGVLMPYQVEHFYPVDTGMDSLIYGVHAGLRFRYRDAPERMIWEPKSEG